MDKGILFFAPPFKKFLISIVIVIISFSAILFTATLISMIFGYNLFTGSMSDFQVQEHINFLKLIQALQTIGIFLIPPIIMGYLIEKNSIAYLNLHIKPDFFSLFLIIFLLFTIIPFINLLAEINSKISLPEIFAPLERMMVRSEENAHMIYSAFLNVDTIRGLVLNLLIIAVLPGIGEELLFRGVFQRLLAEWMKNIHLGILFAAILFSAMHLQFYSFLPRLVLGLLMGYLYYWGKSIWLPVFAHFINNAFAVIFYYVNHNRILEGDFEKYGTSSISIEAVVLSIALAMGCLWLIYSRSNVTKDFKLS